VCIANFILQELKYVVAPSTLETINIFDSRFLHDDDGPYNEDSGINKWLVSGNLKCVEKLYLYGCVDFTPDGYLLFNIYNNIYLFTLFKIFY
jgi:hypothetical protein